MSFDTSSPRKHRVILAADGAPESGANGKSEIVANHAIDMKGKPAFLLYATLVGTAATLVPYFWNETNMAWHADPSQKIELSAAGNTVHKIEARGRYCQMRATGLTGTRADLDYVFPIFYGF